MTSVTREEAIKFLEGACRNWSKVPRLSEDDIGDVASELLRFALAAEQRGRAACLAAVEAEQLNGDTDDDTDLAYMRAINHALTAIRNRTQEPS